MSKVAKKKHVLPYHLQFFAEGEEGTYSVDDLNTLLDTMDSATDPQTPPTTEEPPAAEEPPTQEEPPAQQQQPSPDKQAYAFAQLRAQSTQYRNLLEKLAKATGIEYTNETDLVAKLSDDAINKLAAKQQVPATMLKEMDELRQIRELFTAQQLQQKAALGFQTVKTNYSLTDKELQDFVVELQTAGKNPFLQEIDLEKEYKSLHLEDIVTKRVKAEVEAALKKNEAADKHSSTPSKQSGSQGAGDPTKIDTMDGLNALLNGYK